MTLNLNLINRRVYHVDARHVGRITKVVSGFAYVEWDDTGWVSVLYVPRLTFID